MADNSEQGSGTPQEIAFRLLLLIGTAEKKGLRSQSSADRQWILETYEDCLTVAKGGAAPTRK